MMDKGENAGVLKSRNASRLRLGLTLGPILALCGALSLACCAQRSTPPASGIAGTVMKGPMCPGPRRREWPCPDQPVSGVFQVLDAEQKMAGSFRSDEAGKFQLALPPGQYTVVPEGVDARTNPLGGSSRITVLEGEVTQVALRWDTGIR